MKVATRTILMLLFVVCMSFSVMTSSAMASNTVTRSSGVLGGVLNGSAYAGYLKAPKGGGLASVGPLFPAGLGCDVTSQTVSSTAAALHLHNFAFSGSLTDTVTSTVSSLSDMISASSDVQNVNVLTGLITADEVHAIATSNATSSQATSTNDSTFTNLVVAGVHISGTPKPNTTISLAGIGSVVLNEQDGPVNGANRTHIAVTGIDVNVTIANSLGLPIGTHILIAHAQSGFQRTLIPAIVSARAYGLFTFDKVNKNFVKSGPYADASVGCTGGQKTVSVANVQVPVIGSTGTITDTAYGKILASGAHANSSSTVEKVNLLSGLITGDTIMTTSKADFTSSGSASATTTVVNLVVNGQTISAHPAPNTRINLAGLGYVVLNEQSINVTSSSASATVNGVDIYVTTTNSFGLPVGVRIIIAHSESRVSTY